MFSIKKNEKKSKVLSQITRLGTEVFLVTALVVFAVYFFEYFDQRSHLFGGKDVELGKSYPMASNMKTVVLGEETEVIEKDPVFESENYRIKQVTFGGDVTIPMDRQDNGPLEITNVRSELLTTRDEQETKLIVSWKTSKPVISELVYGKNIEQGGITIKEDQYGYAHSAVLSSLDYSSAYTYLIKGKDKWSNESISQQFAFYTGTPRVSLIDLLLGAFKDVFSWAIKE